jgi:soluble lytic murein transglycosylase-like protein
VEIVDEIAAVQRRISQICGELPDDGFGSVLERRLQTPVSDIGVRSRGSIETLAQREGARYRVDPALVEAIVSNESGFDPAATSPAGAQGLMQLMPSTARDLGVTDPYDPAQNVAAGTRYLRGLLDRFKRVDLAVAAYNAGPNAVARYGGVPPFAETQDYVRNVLAEYRRRLQNGNLATNAGLQRNGSIVP